MKPSFWHDPLGDRSDELLNGSRVTKSYRSLTGAEILLDLESIKARVDALMRKRSDDSMAELKAIRGGTALILHAIEREKS